MATASLHAPQLIGALVKLVVADGVEVEPDLVHRLDRGLVVKERREQRRCADQVPGGHNESVLVLGFLEAQVRGQILGATRGHARRGRVQRDRPGRGGLEVPVKVVEAEQLNLDLLGLGRGERRKHQESGQDENEQA